MEKSEVFKSGHTETALNVNSDLSKNEKTKRKGPEIYNKENRFESRGIEEIIRDNVKLSNNFDNEYSNIPEIIRKNKELSTNTENLELNKIKALEDFEKEQDAKKFVDRLAIIASETRRINIDLDLS
jgi:hypothetical protein